MKRKWVMILVLVLAAASVCAFCFRDALMVRLFPKIVLSKAIGETFQQLNERYAESPVHLLTNALDQEGCQQVSLKLDTSTQFMGIAHYDLELHTQLAPNRIQGKGTVSTGSGIMDMDLYLDENFAAISSESLTEGTYYGITYDTFSQDIRGYQLLSFLAGEETLKDWEASVSSMAEMMRRSYTLPEITAEDIRTALLGALTLAAEVKAGEKGCYSISFRAEGDELAEAAAPYLSKAPKELVSLIRAMDEDDDSEVQIVFYLNNKQLTRIEAGMTMEAASYQISAEIIDNSLDLELFLYDGTDLERTELSIQTVSDTANYQEKISVKRTRNGVQSQNSVDYTWDLSSGDMVMNLLLNGETYAIRLNLTGEGERFTLSCQEFEKILSILSGKEKSRPAIGTLTVSPGEPIADMPAYRNLSDWSMEDFMLLIARLGGLVGLKLP